MSTQKKRSQTKISNKNTAELNGEEIINNSKLFLKKEPRKGISKKIRRVPPQYFRMLSVILFVLITCLFFAIVQLENAGIMSMEVHYGYIISILLSLSLPLLGLFAVKRYQ